MLAGNWRTARMVAHYSAGDTATKADLAMLRADLCRAMLFQAGVIVGAVVALLRVLG